jgi:Family of unknown function (DUF6086)
MSYVFVMGDDSIWSPPNSVGQSFRLLSEQFLEEYGIDSCFNWIANDMALIEFESLRQFASCILRDYEETSNWTRRMFLLPMLIALIVVHERCGGTLKLKEDNIAEMAQIATQKMPWS